MLLATRHSVHAALSPAWADWLGHRPFDLTLTLTSERPTHPESLFKRFRYCTNKLADRCYGRRRERTGQAFEWVYATERHRSGWPHAHAVIRLPGVDLSDPLRFSIREAKEFIDSTGGFCRLERPRSQEDVLSYCVKYLVKEGELILSPNLNPLEHTGQLALFQPAHRSHQAKTSTPTTQPQPPEASDSGQSGGQKR